MSSENPVSNSRSRLAAIVDSSGDAIIAKDLSGIITAWNKAAERLFGYTEAEAIGQAITIIFPQDQMEEEAAVLDRIRRGERIEHYETTRQSKDGRIIRVSTTVSPIKDSTGTITGVSRIIRDLTSRDEREQRIRELQAELAHVQRLNELGQVVSALIHEVNQPLAAISNYVNACTRLATAGDQERMQHALRRVVEQTRRAQQIIARMRDFVRRDETRMQAENLPQLIDDTIVLLNASLPGRNAKVPTQLDPAVSLVEIDKVQVQQVLFNLLRNGIEAMEGQQKGELTVTAGPVEPGMVEISVADTGPGLADEVRSKLFQPFITTKTNGMGVGLSVSRAIIETHGGKLWVDDNPGGGAVFRFTIRRAGA